LGVAVESDWSAWAQGRLTRRQVLAGGLWAAGAGAVLAACSSGPAGLARRAAKVAPAEGRGLGAVEHVVILIQENRSFDHYFGTLHGVRGFDDHPASGLGAFAQPYPANTTRPPKGKLLPFHLDTATTDAECTNDITHAWAAQHRSWDGGTMSQFANVHGQVNGPATGPLTMGYYTRQDLSFYYALADAFTICDGYHCSVLGPPTPTGCSPSAEPTTPRERAGAR